MSPLACLREGASRGHTELRPNVLLLSLGLTAEKRETENRMNSTSPSVISMHTAELLSNEVSIFKRQVSPINRRNHFQHNDLKLTQKSSNCFALFLPFIFA